MLIKNVIKNEIKRVIKAAIADTKNYCESFTGDKDKGCFFVVVGYPGDIETKTSIQTTFYNTGILVQYWTENVMHGTSDIKDKEYKKWHEFQSDDIKLILRGVFERPYASMM